jgi:hypothetical protein
VQFRKLAKVLAPDSLCEDARALDLDAFNATKGGFVVARDFDYLRAKFRAAFAGRSPARMEEELKHGQRDLARALHAGTCPWCAPARPARRPRRPRLGRQ